MITLLAFFACEAEIQSYLYDISSTVIVADDSGYQLNIDDAEICQTFRSEDDDTTTEWSVHSERCDTVDVVDGLVVLSNWEGEYFGPIVTVSLDMRVGEERYIARLVDSDDDVWCDNQVATEYDEHNNAVDYSRLCDENYERYMLWSLVVPSDVL